MASWIRGVRWLFLHFCRVLRLFVLVCAARPGVAAARKDGLATEGCSGCHAGGKEVKVTVATSTPSLGLGQTVRLSVAIEALNGNTAGFFLRTTPGVGKLSLVSGEPTKLSGASGVVHASPKTGSGPSITFAVDYTAPTQAGDVEFTAFGLSANGDGKSSGDGFGAGYLSMVFGCTGTKYFPDYDLDGVGSADGDYRMACSPPPNFATVGGDCDNYDPNVHPGAKELCNAHDDNCDGRIDEDLPITKYCEDKDGDGHGVTSSKTTMGCGPSKGVGLCDEDCDDADATAYPTAQEMCNFRDDNCNQRVDENARKTCGEGWCRRSSESCTNTLCVPGEPRAEECNAFDDDCDGVIDNGVDLCGAGKSCREGVCLVGAGAVTDGGKPGPALDAGTARGDAAPVVPAEAGAAGERADSGGCGVTPRRGGDPWGALLCLGVLVFGRARPRRRHRRQGKCSMGLSEAPPVRHAARPERDVETWP
jgi:hypothetical protein